MVWNSVQFGTRVVLLFGALCALTGAAPSDDADPVVALYKRCLGGEANPAVSARACTEALSSRRLNAAATSDVLVARGRALSMLGGHLPEVVENYDLAIKINPQNWDAYYERAYYRIYTERQHARAIEDLTVVVEALPAAGGAIGLRGVAKDYAGLHAEAATDFAAAVELGGERYRRSLGHALVNLDRHDEAMRVFDDAVEKNPRDPENYYYRGRTHFDRGDYAAAEADIEKALAIDPGRAFYVLWHYLAQASAGKDARPALARNAAQIDLEDWPGSVVRLYMGLIGPQEVSPARNPIQWQELGHLCEAKFFLGHYYRLQGMTERAEAEFKAALATGVIEFLEYHHAKVELKRLRR